MHVAFNCEVPVMSGLEKDHKADKPMRPWVNGNTGPLVNLADVVSDLLEYYKDELLSSYPVPHAIKSTEELLFLFEEYNKNVEVESENATEARVFIASMDVEKLYPS